MKITKFGHCCLLIEEKGLRILTDPGNYSTIPEILSNIDVILITHEHADHFHLESLKPILAKNPKAIIVTNREVGVLLTAEEILYTLLEHGDTLPIKEVLFEGYGEKHEVIYPGWKDVLNTGYFIGDKLFYPGDAFYMPDKTVDVLAAPVAGPWMKISEGIDYIKAVKPRVVIPVHDGGLKTTSVLYKVLGTILSATKTTFSPLEEGKEYTF